MSPISENASTKSVEKSGWVFSPPSGLVSLEIAPPAIIRFSEAEELNISNAWIRESEYRSANEQESPETELFFTATQQIQLSEADTVLVLDALLNPPEPTPDLIAAFRRYRSD